MNKKSKSLYLILKGNNEASVHAAFIAESPDEVGKYIKSNNKLMKSITKCLCGLDPEGKLSEELINNFKDDTDIRKKTKLMKSIFASYSNSEIFNQIGGIVFEIFYVNTVTVPFDKIIDLSKDE